MYASILLLNFFQLVTMAALQLAFLCGIDGGIYLGLVKENFLHDCAAIVLASLQSRLAKQIFATRGGGHRPGAHSVVYIYINCPLKNVI